jgi:hypothetical protein
MTFCKEHSLDNGNLQRTIIKNNLHKGFKMIKKEALGQFEGCPPFHPQAARSCILAMLRDESQ